MKILITGGHLAPALAVIDEIVKKANVAFVGRKYTLDQEKNFSLEYLEIRKRRIPFYHIPTARFTRVLNTRSILNILKIPQGFYHALKILKKVRPDLILSFGGFIGFPICFIGFFLRIPIFIHEQTINPGLTNRLIGFLAKKIFISFPGSQKYFPKAKVILSGNPVRKNVLTIHKKPFDIRKNKLVIYITGGSLGSHSVNVHIEKILPELLKKYIIIHQTGNVKQYNDFQRLIEKRGKLSSGLKNNYFLREHIFEVELGYIYSICDLVIGRSGANTITELIAARIPALYIPLPWSAESEQLKHAQFFQKAGVGEIFHQSENSQNLLKIIEKVIGNLKYYKNNFKNVELLYRENAAETIAKTIFSQYSS